MNTLRSQWGGANPLGMLFGIVLMMCMMAYMGKNMLDKDGKVEAITKAQDAACATQRAQMVRDVVMFMVDNPTAKPTIESLAKAGTEIPPCPTKGKYEIHGRHVLCTEHSYQDEFEAAAVDEAKESQERGLL